MPSPHPERISTLCSMSTGHYVCTVAPNTSVGAVLIRTRTTDADSHTASGGDNTRVAYALKGDDARYFSIDATVTPRHAFRFR